MAFQLPNFQVPPVATIADPADPTHAEIVGYRVQVTQWNTTVLTQLDVSNPNHGYGVPYPDDPPVNADQAARIARLQEIRQYVDKLFSIYAAGYAALGQAVVSRNRRPVVAAPLPRPPKMPLPSSVPEQTAVATPRLPLSWKNNAEKPPFSQPHHEIHCELPLIERAHCS